MTADEVVESYIKTRDKIKEMEAQIKELKAFQAKKEEWLLNKLDKDVATGLKTAHGTVFTQNFESVTIADKDIFMDWVKLNDGWEYLEQRVSKSEVLNYMGDVEENGGRPNGPPPGVNYTAIRQVRVRAK